MTNHLPGDDACLSDNFDPERVVAEWTEAVANLYKNYRELSTCIHQTENQNRLREKGNAYIGQCPAGQLIKLVTKMQVTLEKLFQDVSQGDNSKQLTPQQHYRKLADHTLCMNQLNNQAQSRFHLLSLSTL